MSLLNSRKIVSIIFFLQQYGEMLQLPLCRYYVDKVLKLIQNNLGFIQTRTVDQFL